MMRERQRLHNQKPEVKEQKRQYRVNNIEKIREREKLHNQTPERKHYCKNYNKQYNIENKEKIKAYKKSHRSERNAYECNKYHSDDQYRLARLLRSRIRIALKGIAKSAHTIELIRCPLDFLQIWLNSLLQDGQKLSDMELDHTRPCASFDLTDEAQMRMCCSWKNLMPLTKEQNRKKSDTRDLKLEHKHRVKADSFQYEKFNTPFGEFIITVSEYI